MRYLLSNVLSKIKEISSLNCATKGYIIIILIFLFLIERNFVKDHPCVSLRLRDMKKPINVLTGLDYWLDNLMCQESIIAFKIRFDRVITLQKKFLDLVHFVVLVRIVENNKIDD